MSLLGPGRCRKGGYFWLKSLEEGGELFRCTED